MGWSNGVFASDPAGYSVKASMKLTSIGNPKLNLFHTNKDTALFKFFNASDDAEVTLSLFNDEQDNTSPFDSNTFTLSDGAVYLQYTGFPTDGQGNAKDNFRFEIDLSTRNRTAD